MIIAHQLRQALGSVEDSSEAIVRVGHVHHGVPVMLRRWVQGLPSDRIALASAIAAKAGQHNSGTGADYNGRIADSLCMLSLEALVVYYEAQEPGLFHAECMQSVHGKCRAWGGLRYTGPWP